MWDSFFPDVVVAFVGALLTVLIALVTYMLKIRLDEKRAIQSLIDELHRRRAIAEGPEPVIRGAEELPDFVRANASVVSMRTEIRSTRDRVRQVDSLQGPLSEMTRACNRYLELSAASPDFYARYLGDLRRELTPLVSQLAGSRRGIVAHQPGGGAF
ncbi:MULTISPECIES: hypothetical protein [unclassified Microbacterium]|jgi:hypothetical protein|uniref:hypothetical protein n=1 Tax=unclassified Microbacterium TaxID=2609290 RepID=UPI00109B97E5|nr:MULTISPECIES: hypothetical protein [unclassified Microbacterium]MEA1264078.1 hypothetical protein [Microbacterium sp. STF-2]